MSPLGQMCENYAEGSSCFLPYLPLTSVTPSLMYVCRRTMLRNMMQMKKGKNKD